MKLSKASIALLVIQLALVSLVAGKYLYQRMKSPRVWARAAAYDPEMVMRGRYLSLQLTADGCQSTLPNALHTIFPRNADGTTRKGAYSVNWQGEFQFRAKLKVEGNKLVAIRIPEADINSTGVMVEAPAGSSCDAMRVMEPVDFYIPEHAADPTQLKPGQELWIEVTIPPKGPPRPLQLALKNNGAWTPLAFQ